MLQLRMLHLLMLPTLILILSAHYRLRGSRRGPATNTTNSNTNTIHSHTNTTNTRTNTTNTHTNKESTNSSERNRTIQLNSTPFSY